MHSVPNRVGSSFNVWHRMPRRARKFGDIDFSIKGDSLRLFFIRLPHNRLPGIGSCRYLAFEIPPATMTHDFTIKQVDRSQITHLTGFQYTLPPVTRWSTSLVVCWLGPTFVVNGASNVSESIAKRMRLIVFALPHGRTHICRYTQMTQWRYIGGCIGSGLPRNFSVSHHVRPLVGRLNI